MIRILFRTRFPNPIPNPIGVPLILIPILLSSSLAGKTWVGSAHSYTAIASKPHHWSNEPKSDGITFNQLLRALPEPDAWQALRQSYADSLPAEGTSAPEAELMQLLLAYLDGDTAAVNQQLEELESTLDRDGGEAPQVLDDLRRELFKVNEEDAPENVIEQFEQELRRHQPLSEDAIVEIVGSAEMLERIESYFDAQQSIIAAYSKLFAEGPPEDGEPAMLELQEKATQLHSEHAKAVEVIEANQDNPVLQRYVSERLTPIQHTYHTSIQVPDLVTLAGEERARELLTDALHSPVQLNINNADATLRLAREIALAELEALAVPQWSLVHSIDQVELYEGMAAKFPQDNAGRSGYGKKRADAYYFWGLVASGRTDDAIPMIDTHPEMLDNMPYDAVRNLKKAGHGAAVWQFLDQLLVAYPKIDLWDEYMALSAELSQSEHMLETVRQAIEAEGADTRSTIEKRIILASAHLSAGEVEDAVAWLQQALAVEVEGSEAAEAQFNAALKLARLGHLLGESEWVESGIDGAKVEPIEFISEYGSLRTRHYLELAGLYQKLDRYDQAEATIDQLIARMEQAGEALVAKSKEAARDSDPYAYRRNDFENMAAYRADNRRDYQNALVAKMGLLVAQEDYAAAKALLDESSLWLAEDAAGLLTQTDQSPQRRPFGWLVAQTCHKLGLDAPAADALEGLLRAQNGYDPAYALYLKIKGDDAIPYFDKLYAIDQFQERPLIWKAQQLVNQGKITQAEAIATKAIAIDPSDGEQPKNDRMRVYDVMRQIRRAQGKPADAAFFADVLKAIRLSEHADDYYSLGLHTRAIERYLESLNFFQDAYCIQSRVAVRLYDEGRMGEAAVHYRKAYELMPSSFGRVESHCFGCESVFKGEKPQSIAEEVFSGLLVTQPEVPQVHYLMGYLRDDQEREVEALKHFRAAVALDPGYLNAWKKIRSLSRQMSFSQKEKDDLTLRIYALDPLGQHSSPNLHEVADIKAMWQAVLANRELLGLVPEKERVYPLSAAAELAASLPADNNRFNYRQQIDHPADALERNNVVAAIEELFVNLSQSSQR